jgi:hypothetical protein
VAKAGHPRRTIILHGPRDCVAAAIYLVGLSPGGQFDIAGSVGRVPAFDFDLNWMDRRKDGLIQNLVNPIAMIDWVDQRKTPPKINERVTLSAAATLRQFFWAEDGLVPCDLTLSINARSSYTEAYIDTQMLRWSRRCPGVLFLHSYAYAAKRDQDALLAADGSVPEYLTQQGNATVSAYFDDKKGRDRTLRCLPRTDSSSSWWSVDQVALGECWAEMLKQYGWDPRKETSLQGLPELHATINDLGPEGLVPLARMAAAGDQRSGKPQHLGDRGVSLIDLAITSDWQQFLKPVPLIHDGETSTPAGATLDVDGQPPVRATIVSEGITDGVLLFADPCTPKGPFVYAEPQHYAAMAPRIDLDRLNLLSALCETDENLATMIGSEFGRTANGCHVVAFMARTAVPGSPQARGVANVLKHATFNMPVHDYGAPDGNLRTVAAFITSGNQDAWRFLLEQRDPAMLDGEAARCALDLQRDTDQFIEAFGSAPLIAAAKTHNASPAVLDALKAHDHSAQLSDQLFRHVQSTRPRAS